MKRRKFLRRSALAAAATTPLLGLSASPLPGKPRVGHGDFQYKVDKTWGDLSPAEHPVEHCHEMVLDDRKLLHCSVVSPKADVLTYGRNGKLETSFRFGLTEPHGLTLAGEGKDQTFWLTDSAAGGRGVINFDPLGRVIRTLTVPADQVPAGKHFQPTETTVTPTGEIYVADGYGTNKIFHFDVKGQLKNVFGGPEHFDCCHGIVIDDRRGTPELLITSRGKQEFQRWTMDGRHLATHRLPGLWICRPVLHGEYTLFAVIVTKSWYYYDGMVAVLDRDFQVVSLPGGSAPTDQTDFTGVVQDGHTFLNPHDVCPDADGNLYVPQWFSGRTYPVRLRRV